MRDLSRVECLELISNHYIGHIAFISKGIPNILPITYYFDQEHHSILSYSGEGEKIEAMRKNRLVSFLVDHITSFDEWKSVLIYGLYEELTGSDAKHFLHVFSEGVKKVMVKSGHERPRFISDFSNKLDTPGSPMVYRIKIMEIKGKEKQGIPPLAT
jgi:nitroimidazol reductase NimA-like FMN-containing flavoprotein (pyridoxamine 5'-phosphate oxidase superfamily)